MIVVPVLMTSCHVSEYPKYGPAKAHARTMSTAKMNTRGVPTNPETP